MFDNPQQEVKNMSKKLRPIKLSDEAFELFYKEIYAEFGPKDVPPFDPKKAVQEEVPAAPVCEEVLEETPAEVEVAEAPVEVCEEAPEELTPVQEEDAAPEIEVEEEVIDVEEEEEAFPEEDEEEEEDTAVQEEAAKAAALIRNVQDDELIDEDTDGVKLVKPKKEKGIKGLVFTICLELLAIAGVVAYWLLYIL